MEKENCEQIELDYSMDAVERLEKEIECIDEPMNSAIGKFVLEQLKKDSVLKQCYYDRKITLDKICDYILKCAKNTLNGKSGAIEDKVIYGWAIHYIQDEKIEIPKSEAFTLSKKAKESIEETAKKNFYDQKMAELKAKEQKKIEKAKKKREESGQLDLFDFGE